MTTPVQPPAPPAPAAPPTPAPAAPADPVAQSPAPVPVPQPPAQPPTPAPVPTPPPAPTTPPVPTPPTWQPPTPPVDNTGDADELAKLPQWAQKKLTDLRQEAAKYRTSARSETVLRHAYATAPQLGVNGDALLGSVAFKTAAEQLDPSSAEFPAQLAEAVRNALQANPWMAAQAATPPPPPVPGTSGGQFPGAPGAPAPSLDQQIADAEKAGDWKAVVRLQRQRTGAPPAQ